jgi:hypothetical protein
MHHKYYYFLYILLKLKMFFYLENDTVCGTKGLLVRGCIYVEMTCLNIVSSLFWCNLIERYQAYAP